MRTLVERASRWLINNRRPPMDSEGTVDFFGVGSQQVVTALPELLTGREADAFEQRRDALVEQGVPEDLAVRVAVLPPAYRRSTSSRPPSATASTRSRWPGCTSRWASGSGCPTLVARILALPRDDRWQTMARAALRDDLHAVHAQLTAQVLPTPSSDQPVPVRVADWEEQDRSWWPRAGGTLDEICADDPADLARLSVGLRVVGRSSTP